MKKLKNRLPSRESLENNKYLRFILKRAGDKPYLWEFSRNGVVKATLFGVFWAMIPMPFQMIPAAIFAIFFRANILIAVACVWISNPFTMLPILYSSYYIGCHLLGINFISDLINTDFKQLLDNWQSLLIPLLVGSVVFAIICAVIFSAVVWLIYYLRKIK